MTTHRGQHDGLSLRQVRQPFEFRSRLEFVGEGRPGITDRVGRSSFATMTV